MSTDQGAASATKPREDGSPMEFNPYSDSFFDDPYDTYRWMRDEAPVYYSERWDFYALTRNADVIAAHRDWESFSSAYGVTLDALSMRHRFDELKMLILMDPPEHERLLAEGIGLYDAGNYAAAAKRFSRCLVLRPGWVDAHFADG